MKLVRYRFKKKKEIFYGEFKDGRIYKIFGDVYKDNFLSSKKGFKKRDIVIMPPCIPSKIIALAINYEGATGQTSKMLEPLVFLKSPNSIILGNKKIKIPFKSNTWGESELGFVVKKDIKRKINIKEAKKYIFGFLPVNDLSCDNIENRDHHLARSKSADGFCPLGNYIDTSFDYKNKKIKAFHNRILLREGNTNQMLWKPEKILSWLSSWMTLNVGDLVITGTPSRIRKKMFLKKNDSFTVKIEGFPDLVSSFHE